MTGIVGQVADNFLKPSHLLVGLLVTAGTLAILSRVLPGVGVWVGLNPAPIVPLNKWPFQPSMNGSPTRRTMVSNSSLTDNQSYLNAVFSAIGN